MCLWPALRPRRSWRSPGSWCALPRARGVSFADTADGVLKALTKTVVDTALEEELCDHLGYDKHDPAGRNGGNSRNGTRTKTVLTDTVGEIEIQVPRDRAGSFDPQIVRKHQRRLTRVDEIVLSLSAKGLTTGEIAAHFDELYEAKISADTISRITDKIIAEMADWVSRPLESIYAAIFIDALSVKVRDGQVANRPFYAAIGVDLAGHKDVLGLWAGDGAGESAKFWFAVLTELRNRGVADVFFLVCDGLKGLPDVVAEVWAGHHRAGLHGALDSQQLPLPTAAALGCAAARSPTDLHRAHRRSRRGGPRPSQRPVGRPVPGADSDVAVVLERVHPVPGL